MAELDEILIETAKSLSKIASFLKNNSGGESITLETTEIQEVSDIIEQHAGNLRRLARKVG